MYLLQDHISPCWSLPQASCYFWAPAALLPPFDSSILTDNGTPLQYSCLENPMDRGGWWAAVHAVTKSWTGLSDFTFTFHSHALEKEMATHSSILAWRIPGTEEPSGLPSMGLHRVGHDWSDLAAAAVCSWNHCTPPVHIPCSLSCSPVPNPSLRVTPLVLDLIGRGCWKGYGSEPAQQKWGSVLFPLFPLLSWFLDDRVNKKV